MSLDTKAMLVGCRYELQETKRALREAEAEVERLTAEVERLRDQVADVDATWRGIVVEKEAEVERLRAFAEWVRDEPVDPVWSYTEQKRRARIALAGDA